MASLTHFPLCLCGSLEHVAGFDTPDPLEGVLPWLGGVIIRTARTLAPILTEDEQGTAFAIADALDQYRAQQVVDRDRVGLSAFLHNSDFVVRQVDIPDAQVMD